MSFSFGGGFDDQFDDIDDEFNSQSVFSSSATAPRRRGKKKQETFATYIYKLLKSIHPSLGLSKNAMTVLNSFIFDFFHRICKEAKNLQQLCSKLSLSERQIQTSIQLILPQELSKHTVSEIGKAVIQYQSTLGTDGNYGSRSTRCGLIFPVGRIQRYIKQYGYSDRVSNLTPICLTAALQYLTSELLESTGNIVNDQNKKRIEPRHILFALQNDDDLSKLTENVCIPNAGVKPDMDTKQKTSLATNWGAAEDIDNENSLEI